MWFNIFAMAVGTLAIRVSIIAFIAPAAFYHQGSVTALAGKERFVILVAATFVSFYTRSTFLTIAFGLGALYGLTHL